MDELEETIKHAESIVNTPHPRRFKVPRDALMDTLASGDFVLCMYLNSSSWFV